jgi:hypothetical protein
VSTYNKRTKRLMLSAIDYHYGEATRVQMYDYVNERVKSCKSVHSISQLLRQKDFQPVKEVEVTDVWGRKKRMMTYKRSELA